MISVLAFSLVFIPSSTTAWWGLRDDICYATVVEAVAWDPSPAPFKDRTRIPLRPQCQKKLSCFGGRFNLVGVVSLLTGGFPSLLWPIGSSEPNLQPTLENRGALP